MIGKVFLTESGRMRKTGAAALALCAGAMLVCGLIYVGSAARAPRGNQPGGRPPVGRPIARGGADGGGGGRVARGV